MLPLNPSRTAEVITIKNIRIRRIANFRLRRRNFRLYNFACLNSKKKNFRCDSDHDNAIVRD